MINKTHIIAIGVMAAVLVIVMMITLPGREEKNFSNVESREDTSGEGYNSGKNGSQDEEIAGKDDSSDPDQSGIPDTDQADGIHENDDGNASDPDNADASTEADDPSDNEEDNGMTELEKTAAARLEKMTLREKIYQMCIITPEQVGGEWPVTAVSDNDLEKLSECPVGGIIFFEANLTGPEQTAEMLSTLQEYSVKNIGLPLFLCVDEEGGRVVRIAKNPAFGVENPGPMKKVESANEALEIGRTIGKYLSELGFNVDFAPDADVLTAPGSVIIGDRSFGDDPEKVTGFASAVSDGLHEYGILSCFKHFPGHGAVEADTHKGLAYTDKSLEELMECEIIPFAKAEEKNIDMIMAAHISVPGILGDNTPCSLSEYMLTTVLKEKLGYKGLIITDALNMGAVTDVYSPGESAKAAVQAGADIILMPPDLEEAVSAVEEAVINGEISEELINAAVMKIMIKKYTILFTGG